MELPTYEGRRRSPAFATDFDTFFPFPSPAVSPSYEPNPPTPTHSTYTSNATAFSRNSPAAPSSSRKRSWDFNEYDGPHHEGYPQTDHTPEQGPSKRTRRDYQLPADKECTICCEELAYHRFPQGSNLHKDADESTHAVCYSCWEQHLHTEVESKDFDKLSCPSCRQILEMSEIQALDESFTDKVEPKAMDKAAKAFLRSDENWVECPSAACSFGSLMLDGHIFNCQVCEYRYCFSCQVPMHEGESCSEYQDRINRNRDQEEELSLGEVNRVSKGCPNCTVRIHRTSGCDHMTCSRCRHEFCWLCFADYGGPNGIHRAGNSAHVRTCAHYFGPGRLEAEDPLPPQPAPHQPPLQPPIVNHPIATAPRARNIPDRYLVRDRYGGIHDVANFDDAQRLQTLRRGDDIQRRFFLNGSRTPVRRPPLVARAGERLVIDRRGRAHPVGIHATADLIHRIQTSSARIHGPDMNDFYANCRCRSCASTRGAVTRSARRGH